MVSKMSLAGSPARVFAQKGKHVGLPNTHTEMEEHHGRPGASAPFSASVPRSIARCGPVVRRCDRQRADGDARRAEGTSAPWLARGWSAEGAPFPSARDPGTSASGPVTGLPTRKPALPPSCHNAHPPARCRRPVPRPPPAVRRRDAKRESELSGRELLETGLPVSIPVAPGAPILNYAPARSR